MPDCSPPGSSVLGVFQATILQGAAISSSRGFSLMQEWNWYLLLLLHWEVDSLSLSNLGSLSESYGLGKRVLKKIVLQYKAFLAKYLTLNK